MKAKIIGLLSHFKVLFTIEFWKTIARFCVVFPPSALRATLHFASFFILLILFLISKLMFALASIPFLGKFILLAENWYGHHLGGRFNRVIAILEKSKKTEIKRSYLISIGYKNLLVKKTRTLITILGMSVGVGVIVYLLSLGFGVERLIIGQVASLDELKIIDVTTGTSASLRLNNAALNKIKAIQNVEDVMPVSSFVGRVEFNNARSDVLVYSAPNDYLTNTRTRVLRGKLFANNDSYYALSGRAVAGASTGVGRYGEVVSRQSVMVSATPDKKSYIYSSCSAQSPILGLLSRMEGGYEGRIVWGENYDPYFTSVPMIYDEGRKMYLAEWVKGEFPLFYEIGDGTVIPKLDQHGRQEWSSGCIPKNVITLEKSIPSVGKVLSVSSSSAALTTGTEVASESAAPSVFANAQVSTSSGGLEVVSLNSSEAVKKPEQKLEVTNKLVKEAIVSSSFLTLFNIKLDEAVGTVFNTSFSLSKSHIPGVQGKAVTDLLEYKIIGVLDDEEVPYFYVPLENIKELKVDNFSQVKVVMKDKDVLGAARTEIEGIGFRTSSTLDTVAQIESLFGNLRLVLGLLGLVALGVASLGMFNTLTVSLLERTREIGGMKTMGMISEEVQDLFLSEAMILGLAGGFGGLMLGILTGELTSFLVSLLAFSNGQEYLRLTYVPPYLVLFIVVSSFVVGLVTGLYPARRAKKISALNALRYE